MKKCNRCGETKTDDHYYKTSGICKECHKEKYLEKREDILLKAKNKRLLDPDFKKKCDEYSTNYRKNNPEYFKKYYDKYHKEHPDYNKKYYDEHKEEYRKRTNKDETPEEMLKRKEKQRKKTEARQFRFENDIEYRKRETARKTQYVKDRKNRDPQYKLSCSIRYRIRSSFRNFSKEGKKCSCAKYGIDISAIILHVGLRPAEGYDLDHIIPLSAFNLDNHEHVKMVNNPHNFRWLTEKENLDKSDIIFFELIKADQILLEIATAIGIKPEHDGMKVKNIKHLLLV